MVATLSSQKIGLFLPYHEAHQRAMSALFGRALGDPLSGRFGPSVPLRKLTPVTFSVGLLRLAMGLSASTDEVIE